MLHQKTDGVTAFTTPKTFIDFFGRRNGKRRRPFIMKRTEAKVIGPPFLQLYKTTNDIHNINAAENLLYGILGNQNSRIGLLIS